MKPGKLQIAATSWVYDRRAAKPCGHLRRTFLSGASRTVMDESGSLAITAWTCADCGGLIEEVHILSGGGMSGHRPIRQAVARQQVANRPSRYRVALTRPVAHEQELVRE